MSQEAIINLLQKVKRPLTRTEIASQLKERPEKISFKLKKLLASNEVNCIQLDRFQARAYIAGVNRTIRLYYLPEERGKQSKK